MEFIKSLNLIELFKEVGISGIFDIAFMSILTYTVLLWFKRARSASVLAGIIIIGIIYLFSRQFNMVLTTSVFQQFFAVILIVVVVIFQEELRKLFEQIGVWSFTERNPTRKDLMQLTRKEVEILVRTLTDLAREKIGAIIVIRGKDLIERHLEGGIELNGELSETLLKSIFYPNSPGHDGAVIIENNKITKFSCHLPLSKNFQKLQRFGTRHAAALGMSELTDAICLIVSEEKGKISIASNGNLQQIDDLEKLNVMLERFYRLVTPNTRSRPWFDYLRKNSFEKFIALVITICLWFVLVHESRLVYKELVIPIQHAELSSDLILEELDPKEVKVTFSGPRTRFYFFNKEEIKMFLKLLNTKEGTRNISVSRSDLIFPSDLTLENIEPRQVKVSITKLNKENDDE